MEAVQGCGDVEMAVHRMEDDHGRSCMARHMVVHHGVAGVGLEGHRGPLGSEDAAQHNRPRDHEVRRAAESAHIGHHSTEEEYVYGNHPDVDCVHEGGDHSRNRLEDQEGILRAGTDQENEIDGGRD